MLPSLITIPHCPFPSEGMYNCTMELACALTEPLCSDILPFFKVIAAFFTSSPPSPLNPASVLPLTEPPLPFSKHPICSELRDVFKKAEKCFWMIKAKGFRITESNLKLDSMRKDWTETCHADGRLKKPVKENTKIAQARRKVYEELVKLEKSLKDPDLTRITAKKFSGSKSKVS
jgi:hypothetical protein